jgi:hypothetical protein
VKNHRQLMDADLFLHFFLDFYYTLRSNSLYANIKFKNRTIRKIIPIMGTEFGLGSHIYLPLNLS